MKYAILVLVCLLSSCRIFQPDYIEVTPFISRGDNNFARPVTNFETESYGVGVGFGWLLGTQYRAMRNLERLDVSNEGRLTLREEHVHEASNVIVTVGGDETNVDTSMDVAVDLEDEEGETD